MIVQQLWQALMPLVRYVFLASRQPNSCILSSNHLLCLRLHWLIPKTIVANPNTDPRTVPAIVAFSEGCWRGSVGDDVDDVNNDTACVVAVPARMTLDVEVDEVDDDELLSATHLETQC
jgi:hypothetical protein